MGNGEGSFVRCLVLEVVLQFNNPLGGGRWAVGTETPLERAVSPTGLGVPGWGGISAEPMCLFLTQTSCIVAFVTLRLLRIVYLVQRPPSFLHG
jgi:hypothetical protein